MSRLAASATPMVRSTLVASFTLACVLLSSTHGLAAPPPYYPPIEWIPAASSNYDTGRSAPILGIVIHQTDGSWTSAIHWFRNPRARVSSHYLVRAWGGGIIQFVAESDTAYHARNANPWSIGIEHEFYPRQGIWHTDAQYRSSAALVCAIARRYGIPLDRDHIVGHNELPDATHGDPGPSWNWNYYMTLIHSCSAERARSVARSLRTVSDHGYVPSAGLAFEDVSDEVALLQWDLAYLGHIDPDEVSAGGGRFGPLTQAALTAFQDSTGIASSGSYDESTAGALVRSLVAAPADVPVEDLDLGAESDAVAHLQTALQRLGYMDLVTGYYGQITLDAVTRFQQDNGIESNGAYGPITRMALATRTRLLASDTASEPLTAAPIALGDTGIALLLP
jgi:N-acetyl-anhydromuramyl-L-alanine amidase AmpD